MARNNGGDITAVGCLVIALAIAIQLAWWGFIAWCIWKLVSHFTGA